jgi:hypothetical protein
MLLLCVSWHKSSDFFCDRRLWRKAKSDKPLLKFWNTEGALVKAISVGKAEYRNITWNAKGDRSASAIDALRIWDKNGNLLHETILKDNLWDVSWNRKEPVLSH